MRIYDCVQGSEEWEDIRKGRPTASRFGDIFTPAKLELSKSSTAYAVELALEIAGVHDPQVFMGNDATERGHENEPVAVDLFEMETSKKTEEVGFVCPDDSSLWGCSPDRFVLDNLDNQVGLLEVKTRYPRGMAQDLLDLDAVRKRHALQCQAQMWITGMPYCTLMIYCPELVNHIFIDIEACKKTHARFAEVLPEFVAQVHDIAGKLEPARLMGLNLKGLE